MAQSFLSNYLTGAHCRCRCRCAQAHMGMTSFLVCPHSMSFLYSRSLRHIIRICHSSFKSVCHHHLADVLPASSLTYIVLSSQSMSLKLTECILSFLHTALRCCALALCLIFNGPPTNHGLNIITPPSSRREKYSMDPQFGRLGFTMPSPHL